MRSRRRRADLAALAGESRGRRRQRAILCRFKIALLEDDSLSAPGFARIAAGELANRAWSAAIDPEISSYDQAEDPYFRARAFRL